MTTNSSRKRKLPTAAAAADSKLTTISISHKNHEILKRLGYTGDSFNDILDKLFVAYPDITREEIDNKNK